MLRRELPSCGCFAPPQQGKLPSWGCFAPCGGADCRVAAVLSLAAKPIAELRLFCPCGTPNCRVAAILTTSRELGDKSRATRQPFLQKWSQTALLGRLRGSELPSCAIRDQQNPRRGQNSRNSATRGQNARNSATRDQKERFSAGAHESGSARRTKQARLGNTETKPMQEPAVRNPRSPRERRFTASNRPQSQSRTP